MDANPNSASGLFLTRKSSVKPKERAGLGKESIYEEEGHMESENEGERGNGSVNDFQGEMIDSNY